MFAFLNREVRFVGLRPLTLVVVLIALLVPLVLKNVASLVVGVGLSSVLLGVVLTLKKHTQDEALALRYMLSRGLFLSTEDSRYEDNL